MVIAAVPSLPWSIYLAGWVLMLFAIWLMRRDLSEFAHEHPAAVRFTGAMVFAVVAATSLQAAVIYVECDWDSLLQMCDGSEWCAWGWWIAHGCAFRPV